MGLFNRLFGAAVRAPASDVYTFRVQCGRCGEIIEGRVNLNNELSVEYENGGDVYFVRKTAMGIGKCFQQIEVELKFDPGRQLLARQIRGGTFVE